MTYDNYGLPGMYQTSYMGLKTNKDYKTGGPIMYIHVYKSIFITSTVFKSTILMENDGNICRICVYLRVPTSLYIYV